MKLRLTVFAAALLAAGAVSAQPYDTYREIYSRSELASGVHTMYPTDQPAPRSAPAGYKPFYISHIGRHGARYPLGETVYEDILEVFTDAAARGLLTAKGEEFLKVYSEFYPLVAHREGELTFKGQEQHRYIVRRMYRDYPGVFEGPTRACAVATHIHRVIASMYSFLGEARELDPDFTYTADYGISYLPVLLPSASECPGFEPLGPSPEDVLKMYGEYCGKLVDVPGILGLWFKETESLGVEPYDLLADLNTVYSTFTNLDAEVPGALWAMFSFDDRYRLWEYDNCRWYLMFGRAPGVKNYTSYMGSVVGDVIGKASSDWQEGIALRLRFTHDSTIASLLTYLDVDGMGAEVSDPGQVRDYWRNFEIPMAANLQFVFFRRGDGPAGDGMAVDGSVNGSLAGDGMAVDGSANGSLAGDADVLLQVLHNGFEATLPLPEASSGFYRWSDFVDRYSR